MPRRFLRRFPRGATLASRGNREFSYNVENGDGKKITLLNYQSCTNYREYRFYPDAETELRCSSPKDRDEKSERVVAARGACKLIFVSKVRANCP